MHQTFITHYPSLAKPAEIILPYPSSRAEVERGSSYKNAMKTKFCNRLSSNHLYQLFRLQLNASQPPEFSFHRAYKNWVDFKDHHNTTTRQTENRH